MLQMSSDKNLIQDNFYQDAKWRGDVFISGYKGDRYCFWNAHVDKAFGRVEWDYLFDMMKGFKFTT